MNEPVGKPQHQVPKVDPREERGPGLSVSDLEGVRAGQEEALERFFNACFDLVYGLAFRLTGHRQAAEDVTQEVFLRAHKAAPTLDPQRDPRPWLRTITANLCRDRWRSFASKVGRHAVSRDDEDAAPPLASSEPAADAGLLRAEKQAAVQGALDRLPTDLREVVVLRDYEGLEHTEIAAMLGASHAAVRKRYSRALTRLGELLKDEWP